MCLSVNANGAGSGAGTHVSVYVCLMRGEHDKKLKWPFRGDVTIQLLNQKENQEHMENTVHFGVGAMAYGSAARVTSGEYGTGQGCTLFISHVSVESITGTTQYLNNDCLKWRVANIVVHSV